MFSLLRRLRAAGLPAEGNRVSAGFFSTFGIPLLRGRDFGAQDVMGAPAVAIVSESFAKAMWPDADPIGRSFARVNTDGSRGGSGWAQARQVIGVVADTRSPLQTSSSRLSFYSALAQTDIRDGVDVHAIAAGTTPDLASVTRTAIEADRSGQTLTMFTGDEMIAREMYPFRAAAWLLGVAGVAGIVLAALGLYGVVAHSVAQQTREFGIPGVIGATLALRAAGRWSQMAPVIDPLTITAILIFIVTVVLVACYIPARRAAGVNPALTLRAE